MFSEQRRGGGTGDGQPRLYRNSDDGRWGWNSAAGGPLPLVIGE